MVLFVLDSGKGPDYMSTASWGPKPTLGTSRLYSRNSQTKMSLPERTLSGSRNTSRTNEPGPVDSPRSEVLDGSPDLTSKRRILKNKKKNFLSVNRRYSINQAHLSAHQNVAGGKNNATMIGMKKSTSFSNSKPHHDKSRIENL